MKHLSRSPSSSTFIQPFAWALISLLVLAGCGSSDVVDEQSPPSAQPASTDPHAMECVQLGEPCRWPDVTPALAARSIELARELSARLGAGESVSMAVAWLRGQHSDARIEHDARKLRFVLKGSRPVWVMAPGARLPLSVPASKIPVLPPWGDAATSTSALRKTALSAAGEPIVAPGQATKRALVLSPYWFDLKGGKAGDKLARLLSDTPGYEGRVNWRFNATPNSTGVGVADFTKFADFDVIALEGHGAVLCQEDVAGEPVQPCRQVILAQRAHGNGHDDAAAALPGVEIALSEDGNMDLFLGADFFRHQYPQGLENRLILLSACETAKQPDLMLALQGSSSVVVGWSNVVPSDIAAAVDTWIFEGLQRGWPIQKVIADFGRAVAVVDPDPKKSLELRTNGRDIRIRELISPVDAIGGQLLADGRTVEIRGRTGDGEPDALVLRVTLDGIDNAKIDQFVLDMTLEGRLVKQVSLGQGTQIFEGRWQLEVEMPLGRDVAVGETLELQFALQLPEGGSSRLRVNPIVGQSDALPERWAMTAVMDSNGLFSTSRKTSVAVWRLKSTPGLRKTYYQLESLRVHYQGTVEFRVGSMTCSSDVSVEVDLTPSSSATLWFDTTMAPVRYASQSGWTPEQRVPVQVVCGNSVETVQIGVGGQLWNTNFDEDYPAVEGSPGMAQSGVFNTGSATPTIYRWSLTPLR